MNKLIEIIIFLFILNKRSYRNYFLLPAILVILLASLSTDLVSAQEVEPHWHVVRTIDTTDFGVVNPEGVTFLPDTNMFLVVDQSGNFTGIDMREQFSGTSGSQILVSEATNFAFDQNTNSLFSLDEVSASLDKIGVTNRSLPFQPSGVNTRIDVSSYSLQGPKGITFDPNGRLIILDTMGAQIIIIVPDLQTGLDGYNASRDGRIKRIDLKSLGGENFQGIAFNPNNGHLYSLDPGDQRMVEIDENGIVAATYDLSSLHLVNPKTLLFAPSRNVTDDPSIMNLFILDGSEETALNTLSKTDQVMLSQSPTAGGQIIEISFNAPVEVSAASLIPTTLVRTIDTSNAFWNPSSPDPGGIAYWPSRGSLLISDSEVDEMPPYFTGVNVFESSLTGSLLDTCSTTTINRQGWSNEPTGVAINPSNNHIFFSDDSVGGRVHEVSPGIDGVYCTGDDSVTTVAAPGGGDAEGVAYGNNTLYIAGGTDNEVYKFSLGTNGILGGGDDSTVTSFDTGALGFQDLEGIEYNPDRNTLFIVSTYKNDKYLGEVSLTGLLIDTYDLSYLGSQPRSGLAYGPSSQNPAVKSIYLSSRGVDNNVDPNENDGKIWEIDLRGDGTPPTVNSIVRANASPTNAASVGFTVTFSESVTGVDASDFSLATTGVSGAAVSGISGSGASRTVTVNTGSGNGTIRLDLIDNDSIKDVSNNPLGGTGAGNGTYTSGQVYTIDKTGPSVSSITRADANPTNASSVGFTVTFSASVTGVDTSDFSLATTGVSGATVSGVSGSGATRTVTVDTGSGSGTIRLDLIDNDSIKDSSNNPLGGTGAGNGSYTSGQVYTIDKTGPSVSSSTRANASPTNASSVGFTVTFSESVTGVDASDFSLTTTGVSGASVSGVSGSGATRTVTVNTGSGSGTIRLDLIDNDSIVDSVGNPLGGNGTGNGSFTSGQVYTISKQNADTTGVFRPSNGALYLKNSNTTGFADIQINYGQGGDYPVTGDWDGDGTDTIGIYRNGSFYLRNSNTIGFADLVFAFGAPGDQPIAGDWNGDGTDTIGVYRPSTGQFLLRNSNTAGAADASFYLGNVGDVGIAGDWNGDGVDTTGVFRPSNGALYLKNTNATGFADIQINYGLPGDMPVTGDWDGDGDDTIGIYRNGAFYLRNSNTIGFADIVFSLGSPGDMPIAGEWDGQP